MATAWVLNLDADVELALPAGAAYTPKPRLLALSTTNVTRLAGELLAPGDALVDERTPPGSLDGFLGRAFCPTRRARALLERSGATVARSPPVDVLRSVNGRGFCAALGQTLPGACFVRTVEEACAVVRTAPDVSMAWRLKRAHGMAGRGQRVVPRGEIDAAVAAYLAAGVREGGVQIEPDVRVVTELALHGNVSAAGDVELGRVVVQTCDAHGQWTGTTRTADVAVAGGVVRALEEETARVATALYEAGYFGPFGVDAFTYAAGDAVLLQTRSEINARLSMGYVTGFGRVPPT